jgi:hypothetical protein
MTIFINGDDNVVCERVARCDHQQHCETQTGKNVAAKL